MTPSQGVFISAVLLFALLTPSSAQLDGSCIANSGAVLSTPVTPSWSNDRQVFNEKVDRQPAGVAFAHSAGQVQALVQCAQASGLKAVSRGGGHGYEGYAVQDGALTIDVTNLTSFEVDLAGSTATFGTGLRLGQLFYRMYEDADSLFPAGLCPWVGSAGHILGGGTGLNSRAYGLACDQLEGLTMVDYQGRLLNASRTENPDLLWASCGGGGGNLGIVTSYTVRLHSLAAAPQATTIEIGWSGFDNAVQIFDKVQRWAPYADRRMSVQILLGFGGVSLNAQYLGNRSDAVAELGKSGVLQIPGTSRDNIVERTWMNATLLWAANTMGIPTENITELNMAAGLPSGVRNYFQAASSYNQELMSLEGIQTMVNAIKGLDTSIPAFVEHKMLLGAVSDVGPNDTAFFWRNSLYESQWMYAWSSGNQSVVASEWLNSTMAAMQPFIGQGAYINYPDPLLAATASWPQRYYGGNLQTYIAVKTKYDPMNFFSNPLTVRPSVKAAAATPSAAPGPASAPAAVLVGSGASAAPKEARLAPVGGPTVSPSAGAGLPPPLPLELLPVATVGSGPALAPLPHSTQTSEVVG